MDFHLKQRRNQHEESGQQPSAKTQKLLMDPHQAPQHPRSSGPAAFPLFLQEPGSKISSLSAFPDSSTAANIRLPDIAGNYFSLEQWQELELQALIYRFMVAGVAIPPELLQPIKKSLLHPHSPPCFLHHSLQQQCSYYQPSLLQTGYWGRADMDPEPGRCRRTDGKKWRCSRDVVAGHNYCERHLHRGRNRSRKPVENPTPTISTNVTCTGIGGAGGTASAAAFNHSAAPTISEVVNGTHFSHTLESPSIHFNHSSKTESKGLIGPLPPNEEAGNRYDGHILWHFFDDWPRSVDESGNVNGGSSMNSLTCLSVSMPGNSPASDVSLKLSTGNNIAEPEPEPAPAPTPRGNTSKWAAAGWGTNITNQAVASMGGPLAEALRSSTTNSSPTSVLHQLSRPTVSET
ncbi:GROWTH-REGULATING FACTOR 3 [Salix purpurea]|uniref:Growth-regulating factor n=1 Tax=Salix purpurea TaxID=77065 RepID=A0A9Q0Q3G2_SALPP|nr:GROWTH-REGULATING FACTOR 3 [Salix purpurea]